MASLREAGIAVAAFLVEYVVVFVVSENLVEVDVASATDDLAAGVTAAVVVVVAFADVALDYDYIVCPAADVVVFAGYVVFFVVVVVFLFVVCCSFHFCCCCMVSLLLLMLMHNI